MGDIFNLDTTSFLIIHTGALIAVGAVIALLKQAYEGLKAERENCLAIKRELHKIKSDLQKAMAIRQEVETVLDEFEEENTKIRNLKKEIEDYKNKLEKENENKQHGKTNDHTNN